MESNDWKSMTLGLIIFLGSDEVLECFIGEITKGLEGVEEGFEAMGAFPFADLEALGEEFKELFDACGEEGF